MPTIFLDLDGVLADFSAHARAVLRRPPQEEDINGRWPEEDWRHIRATPHFYRNIPLMPRAHEMVTLARGFRDTLGWELYMLTAIPSKNDMFLVFQDKIDWVNQYFPDISTQFGPYSEDKHQHCTPGDILVDDRTSNCDQWRLAGGIAVKVNPGDYAGALHRLAELYIALSSTKPQQE